MRPQLVIENVSGGFADVGQVRNETVTSLLLALYHIKAYTGINLPCSTKKTRKQVSMNPFVPLGVASGIWFLILGLEYADNLSIRVSGKVAARATLGDHARVDLLPNSQPHAVHNGVKLCAGHYTWLRLSQTLWRNGPNTVGGSEDGMLNLETLILASGALTAAALELGGNLIRPALQAGVDGLDVDAAGATDATAKLWPRTRRMRAGHARAVQWLCDGRKAWRRCRLKRRRRLAKVFIFGVVAELVGLRQAFVASRGRACSRHRSIWRQRGCADGFTAGPLAGKMLP